MNKIETISNLFEEKEIRSIWDKEKEDYYYSVVDVIEALTDAADPVEYWHRLRKCLTKEGYEPHDELKQIIFKHTDGKEYIIDTFNIQGIFRIIQSIKTPEAEKYKLWIANLGSERIDEVFDPEKIITRTINYYKKHGHDDKWIINKLETIINQ